MRRALVVYGDTEIGNAITEGIESNQKALVPIEVKQNFFQEDVKRSLRAATGFRNWKQLYCDMIASYGFPEDYRRSNIIAEKALLLWALMWYGIFEWYKRLSDWNRQA